MKEFLELDKYLESLPYEPNKENIARLNLVAYTLKGIITGTNIERRIFINTPMKGKGLIEFEAKGSINVEDCKQFSEALSLADNCDIFAKKNGNVVMGIEIRNISELKEKPWESLK